MQFLAPLFFVALAGLAIPVLLHLTQREKKQIVRFPSLMFVRRIPYQSVRRRKIQQLAAADGADDGARADHSRVRATAARPRRTCRAAPAHGARELVILLDTSYSMGYGDRWDRARRPPARDEIATLARVGSRRRSCCSGRAPTSCCVRPPSASRLQAAVDAATPSPSSTRFAPALKVAGSILADSTLPQREACIDQRLSARRVAR